jgi:di/tricarboxylate transporter
LLFYSGKIFVVFWFLFFKEDKENCKYEACLDWKFVTVKMPWGVLLLLGSGFAIADASVYSGLSAWIGERLEVLDGIPDPVILLMVVILTSVLTEVVSSVACANILLPVIVSVVRKLIYTYQCNGYKI